MTAYVISEGPELRRVEADLVSEPLQLLGNGQEVDLGAAGCPV